MSGESRRQLVLNILHDSAEPVSATKLAAQFDVSRQIIVGDIALLRASGIDIIATARGYTTTALSAQGRYIGKIVCQHSIDGTKEELSTIVNLGAQILDVIVDHYLYGEINGQLNISCQRDVTLFISDLEQNKARLLSELTGGVHTHTIACRDSAHFKAVSAELNKKGFLYSDN